MGKHDFTTFRAVQCQANSPVKDSGQFSTASVVCRGRGDFIDVEPVRVDD